MRITHKVDYGIRVMTSLAVLGDELPGKPISRDNWRSLQLDSVSFDDGLRRLGIAPTPVEPQLAGILAGC